MGPFLTMKAKKLEFDKSICFHESNTNVFLDKFFH